MWLAHALTLLRLPLIPVFWLGYGTPVAPAAIGVAALSDALDGWVARRAQHNRPPPWPTWWTIGGWLDPLVDKLFIAAVLVAMIVRSPHDVALVGLVAVREIALVPLIAIYAIARMHRERVAIHARPLGKATTVAQLVTIATMAGGAPGATPLAIACAVLGLAATVDYVVAARRASREMLAR